MSNTYSQIFKKLVPSDKLFELLNKICAKTDRFFIVDNNSYKKGMFTNDIAAFFDFCKPFYYISKRNYLDRELTNKSFLTIVRQICKSNNITYTSQIMYNKSQYDIVYYVYFN